MKWRLVSRVLCEQRIPNKIKGKILQERPLMTHGAEHWLIRKQQMQKMSVAKIIMQRWMCGKTREGQSRNECIWRHLKVALIGVN